MLTFITLFIQQTTNNKQTRLTAVSFLLHKQLTATHTCYIWMRHRTHPRTRRPEVAVNSSSAFNPSQIVPPPGSSRSSGQLLSARGPGEPSVSVRDWQECSVLFACFSVVVISGGNPLWTRGEHANSTQKGPGLSFNGKIRYGLGEALWVSVELQLCLNNVWPPIVQD